MSYKGIFFVAAGVGLVLAWRGGQVESVMISEKTALQDSNVRAFLMAIRAGESSVSDEAYTMLVYGGNFSDFSKHPNVKKPIKNDARGRKTSAAGAYQITYTTWMTLVPLLGTTRFDPETQDRAAVLLLKRRGALADVMRGDFATAAEKCRNEWEAFTVPALYKRMAQAFDSHGGVYVA